MKSIPGNNAGPHWKNGLLNDLAFIRRKKRYPFSKKTVPATAILVLSILYICRTVWMAVIVRKTENTALMLFAGAMMIIILFSGIVRFWYALRFSSVSTPFFANDNVKLLKDFLSYQQLNIYRHPEAPEVFQIISRPLGNNDEKREVMIFIADDKRILINSHFTNQKWFISSTSRNSGSMARNLAKWIVDNRTTEIMVM